MGTANPEDGNWGQRAPRTQSRYCSRHCFADSQWEEVTSCPGWARVSLGFLIPASIRTDPESHGPLFSVTPHCPVSFRNLPLPDQVVQLALVPLYHTGARVEALQFQRPSGWRVYSPHSEAVNQRVLPVLIKASHLLPRSSLLHRDCVSLCHVKLGSQTKLVPPP